DHLGFFSAGFLRHAPNDLVDHSHISEVDARLHAVDGGAADGPLGFFNLDVGQLVGLLEESLVGDGDAGGDHAADVFAAAVQIVEGGGGAEVDDDQGAAVDFIARHRVGDAVSPQLLGRVNTDGHRAFGAVVDPEGLQLQVALAHALHGEIQGRHDAGDDDPVDLSEGKLGELEELLQKDAQLVGGALFLGLQAPVLEELGVPIDSDDGVGVADV